MYILFFLLVLLFSLGGNTKVITDSRLRFGLPGLPLGIQDADLLVGIVLSPFAFLDGGLTTFVAEGAFAEGAVERAAAANLLPVRRAPSDAIDTEQRLR